MIPFKHTWMFSLLYFRKDKKPGKKSKKRRPDSFSDTKISKEQPGIKFPEIKGSGVFLRSSKV